MTSSEATLCGHPLKTRPGSRCTNRAKHFLVGGHSCGTHLKCIQGLPPFAPFQCGICMDRCDKAAHACTTICNHQFHSKCLLEWEKASRSKFTCPLCRKDLPRSIPRSPPHHVNGLMALFNTYNDIPGAEDLVQRLNSMIREHGLDRAEEIVSHMLESMIQQGGIPN